MTLLQVRDLRIAFGTQEVVHGISFDLAAGEKLALVGASGSGKTVTALSLLGLAEGAQLSGQVQLQSSTGAQQLTKLSPRQLRQLCGREVAMIFQEPMTALNPVLTIGEQIAEVLRDVVGLPKAAAARQVVALLEQTGIDAPAQRARAYAHQLSGGQRQRAMIAMALAGQPRLLLADEPTTALDPAVRLQILELLERLQAQHGMAILLITHDLPLVRRFADRVAVMEHGQLVEQGSVQDIFERPQHPCTRQLLRSNPQRDLVAAPPASAEPALQATQLQVGYPRTGPGWRGWLRTDRFVALQSTDFSLRAGETLGVVGASGSGKTTLALASLGLVPFSGTLRVFGKAWGTTAALDRANRKQVQVVFQDPFSSLSPRLTVEEIVGEGLQVHAPELDAAQRRAQVVQALLEVGLDGTRFPGLLQRYAHQFSGGQRQRIAVARALVVQPRALVLDEPTSALDASMARELLQMLQRLQKEKGLAYLFISHDMAVMRAMAHRVVVMQDGQILEQGTAERVFGSPQTDCTRALLAASGLDRAGRTAPAADIFDAAATDCEYPAGAGEYFLENQGSDI